MTDGMTPNNSEDAPDAVSEPQTESDQKGRRLLIALFIFLLVAALGLIVLIIVLLLPDGGDEPLVSPEECPYEVVDAIYGFGGGAADLLNKPLAVTFDPSGNLWVSDTGNARVLGFDVDGELIRVLGTDEDGQVVSPYGLDFSADGQRLYVTDFSRRGVLIYANDGRFVGSIPNQEQPPELFGIDGFSPYHVVALDGSGQVAVASNNGIFYFDRDGLVVEAFGTEERGTLPGQFAFPDAFDVSADGSRIYVADSLNRRIVALTDSGEVLWMSGTPDQAGTTTGFWELPRSVTIGPDGNIYVVDTFRATEGCTGDGHIVVLSPDGELLSEFGAVGNDEGSFFFPEKLAFAPDGRFAVADRENNRVQILRLVGPLPPASDEEMEKHEQSLFRYDD
jgi:DNA-binding beta-propeller fold protein YncE